MESAITNNQHLLTRVRRISRPPGPEQSVAAATEEIDRCGSQETAGPRRNLSARAGSRAPGRMILRPREASGRRDPAGLFFWSVSRQASGADHGLAIQGGKYCPAAPNSSSIPSALPGEFRSPPVSPVHSEPANATETRDGPSVSVWRTRYPTGYCHLRCQQPLQPVVDYKNPLFVRGKAPAFSRRIAFSGWIRSGRTNRVARP